MVDLFRSYFEVVHADTPQLRREAYRLRYQVLAVEHHYLRPEDYPDGEERDPYDTHSAHCLLIHRKTGATAGTVRVVLPRPDMEGGGLPITRHCADPILRNPVRFPPLSCGEISRFSISKEFRRRATDGLIPDAIDGRSGADPRPNEIRRLVPYMTLGLMQGLMGIALAHGLTVAVAIMEKQFLRLLARFGIRFHEIGPEIPLFGWRQPCYRGRVDLLEDLRAERPDVWELVTDDGAYWQAWEHQDQQLRQGAG